MRNMGYSCSDDFRDDIINAAKYLSGVDYGTYANNHGTEYEQAFLCLDYVHMVYGMIVIPTGHDNPGVGDCRKRNQLFSYKTDRA